ncbi:hypothetical protein MRX96_031785 [Rhipicephalus microplus]
MLCWADKAQERRESSRGDESNRGSPYTSELDEMRRANEQLRRENAQEMIEQEMIEQASRGDGGDNKARIFALFGAARPNPGHHGNV